MQYLLGDNSAGILDEGVANVARADGDGVGLDKGGQGDNDHGGEGGELHCVVFLVEARNELWYKNYLE